MKVNEFWFVTGQFMGMLSRPDIITFLQKSDFNEEKQKQLNEKLCELANVAYKDNSGEQSERIN